MERIFTGLIHISGRLEVDYNLMPAITEFTTELTREKEWDNVAAIHSGLPVVTSWSFDKCTMGELKLRPPNTSEEKYLEATCIALTSCGNFVVIGYSSGQVERFNIQSGLHRASYGVPKAHKVSIRGVACDALNQTICSAASNGWIKFWLFKVKGERISIVLILNPYIYNNHILLLLISIPQSPVPAFTRRSSPMESS